jgi:hypothetical protein
MIEETTERSRSSENYFSGSCSETSFRLDHTPNQPRLFEYVLRKKWKKLRGLLKKKNGRHREMCKERDSTGLSLFGFAIASGAPQELLDTILKIDPSQSYSADHFGATPLHIACLNGAPPKAIKYLIKVSKGELVRARDIDSRVPLHHAVECFAREEISYNDAIECIQRLFDEDSTLINCTDRYFDSPVDISQIALMRTQSKKTSESLYMLYKFLRDLSIEEYKRKRTAWENAGFDTTKMPSKSSDKTTDTASSFSGDFSRQTANSSLLPMDLDQHARSVTSRSIERCVTQMRIDTEQGETKSVPKKRAMHF